MLTQLLKSSLPPRVCKQLAVFRSLFGYSLYEAIALPTVVRPQSIGSVLFPFYQYRQQAFERTTVWLNESRYPVELRKGTSDFEVFRDIFLSRQYRSLCKGDPRTLIDAGANIGLTSLYFLHRYPKVRVIALEPDPENYEVAKQNLQPFKHRCELLNAALWSHDTTLAVQRGKFRDGRHWASQVTPACNDSKVVVPAYSVPTLMSRYRIETLDILKIDIEGAERIVFDGETPFLRRTTICAVECHDAAASAIFHRAALANGCTVSRDGEITIASRNTASQKD
jgi:FkbM family methyltransferase